MDDYSCACKYKGKPLLQSMSFRDARICAGLQNEELQIRAHFSEDGRHVICGSDDQAVIVWYFCVFRSA